jgi:hypothetical protein
MQKASSCPLEQRQYWESSVPVVIVELVSLRSGHRGGRHTFHQGHCSRDGYMAMCKFVWSVWSRAITSLNMGL